MLETFINGYKGYFNYFIQEITFQSNAPWWHNYFLWLVLVSLFFFALEIAKPWRPNQPIIRKDFWLDAFYMFFNFFLFSLVIYNAVSDVVVNFFNTALAQIGITNWVSETVVKWPLWAHLLIGFVVRDFVQWWVHRWLHRSEFLWRFHKVHHSVKQMGFAAHLRYHWMETIVYRSVEYLPLALIGISLNDFFIIHIFTLAVGHYNHSNITISPKLSGLIFGFFASFFINHLVLNNSFSASYVGMLVASTLVGWIILGPYMKKIFNSPEMHIWHHAHTIPQEYKYGINFGITLAIWDYLFKTDYVPYSGQNIELGFEGDEHFPQDFAGQAMYGFGKSKQ